ncbi:MULTISPECIES: hypothetical protein [Paraburkholderia]|uniref:Uncharacterized protein n=1 Tax=Paraburkholderia podalyriae TaxID=1938811 RepID=A0ABR7PYY2_9BURK|nr:hypothetical protein [Paraburkholderia podalyriae]MBC8751490.1 hypothetical protein [Paraburkholderia podalyriae]
MIFVFLCLDWVPPPHPTHGAEGNNLALLHPAGAWQECIDKLANCLDGFAGSVGVLATSCMLGRRLSEVAPSMGRLQPKIFDFVNTIAESPYEFVCDYLSTRPGQWVAIVGGDESFPPEHRHRVVSFAGDAGEIDSVCAELANLIDSFGQVAIEAPTRRELALISGDRHMMALMKAQFAASKRAALPND